jgi:hypothetical protein
MATSNNRQSSAIALAGEWATWVVPPVIIPLGLIVFVAVRAFTLG